MPSSLTLIVSLSTLLVLCGLVLAEDVPPYRQAEKAVIKRMDSIASTLPGIIHDFELALALPSNATLRSLVVKNVTTTSIQVTGLEVDLRTQLAEHEFTAFEPRLSVDIALAEVKLLQRVLRTIAVELSAIQAQEPVSANARLVYVQSEAVSVAQVLMQRQAVHVWDHVNLLESALKQALKSKDSKVNATARAEVLDRFAGLYTALAAAREDIVKTYYPEVEHLRALQGGAQLSLLQQSRVDFELDMLAVMLRFARQYHAEFVILNPAAEAAEVVTSTPSDF